MYEMLNSPLVSIIVPVYNTEKYIRNCVESVINQSYKNWELFLVDDGSLDQSGLICDEYASEDLRINVIHKKNGGQAQARNKGIDECRGDYVTFLDSDDFFHQDFLLYMVNVALENDAEIVQCDFVRGNDIVFPHYNLKVIEESYDNHSIFLKEKAKVIVWGKIYKHQLLATNRIREGKYYEDDFTTWRWYYCANKIVVSSNMLYYYTANPSSTMSMHKMKPNFDFFEAYNERIDFFMNTGQKDLEHCSMLQLCKTLVLLYSNKFLNKEEGNMIKNRFNECWGIIKRSEYVRARYKVLFRMFALSPQFTSKVVNFIRQK